MSKIWTAEELLRWLDYDDISDDIEHHEEACEKIKDCIREAFTIPTTSEREVELEDIIIKMQEELDKKPEVTEEWIEERVKELMEMSLYYHGGFKEYSIPLLPAKDFMRSLVRGLSIMVDPHGKSGQINE